MEKYPRKLIWFYGVPICLAWIVLVVLINDGDVWSSVKTGAPFLLLGFGLGLLAKDRH